jgi:hypothetical protein
MIRHSDGRINGAALGEFDDIPPNHHVIMADIPSSAKASLYGKITKIYFQFDPIEKPHFTP